MLLYVTYIILYATNVIIFYYSNHANLLIFFQSGTNKKLGYGFVQFSNLREAAKAIKEMNAKPILGKLINFVFR